MPTPISKVRQALIPTVGTPPSDQRNFSLAYYGGAMSGKTRAMATWPDPLCLYTDKNFATVMNKGIPHVPIPDWKFFHDQCLPALRARKWFTQNEDGEVTQVPFPYRTLLIDTGNVLFDMLLASLETDPKLANKALWGTFASLVTRTVADLTAMTRPTLDHPGCHVVFSFHLRDRTNEAGNVLGIIVDVVGRSSGQVPKLFDTNLLLKAQTKPGSQEPEYYALTKNPSPLYDFLGDRVGDSKDTKPLPTRLDDATYPGLMKAWGLSTEEK